MSWKDDAHRRQRIRGRAPEHGGHPADPDDARSPLYARDLWEEYDANALAADARYHDAVLDVVGRVAAVDRDRRGRITVVLTVGRPLCGVRCRFRDDRLDEVLLLRKGCAVWVRGRCAGASDGSVDLEDCAVLQHAGPSVPPPEMATA
ncbi:OB-fold putative lipoprotein [Myxococcota bacterium]|nr:OB-fold putative lipoprotein [Myxococcota bacterium]